MKFFRDLLYTTDNSALDISRLCSLFGVLTYLGMTIWHVAQGRDFDFVGWGGGWTALCAGCAGWIYARQKWEVEAIKAKNPPPSIPEEPDPWGYPGFPPNSQFPR